MPDYADKAHCKAKIADFTTRHSDSASSKMQDFDIDDSQMLDELKSELRRRSNEIRNTELMPEHGDISRQPDSAEAPGGAAPEKAPDRPAEKRTEHEFSMQDIMQAELVRAVSDTPQPEAQRTRLVGMTETAESSVRRMEYLERGREAKERAAARVPVTAADGDLFDFLLRKRGGDAEENSGREESNDRADKAGT